MIETSFNFEMDFYDGSGKTSEFFIGTLDQAGLCVFSALVELK